MKLKKKKMVCVFFFHTQIFSASSYFSKYQFCELFHDLKKKWLKFREAKKLHQSLKFFFTYRGFFFLLAKIRRIDVILLFFPPSLFIIKHFCFVFLFFLIA